jgi:hypothetical protein
MFHSLNFYFSRIKLEILSSTKLTRETFFFFNFVQQIFAYSIVLHLLALLTFHYQIFTLIPGALWRLNQKSNYLLCV